MALARYLVSGIALCIMLQSPALGDPGFGTIRKKKLSLQVREPAALRLANTSLAVSGSSADRSYLSAEASLTPTLETELLSNEKTLTKAAPGAAEYTVAYRITGLTVGNPQQRFVGNVAYTRWTGTMRVAYQVLGRNGKVFDAGNVNYNFDKEFDPNSNKVSGGFHMPPIPGLHKGTQERAPQSPEDVKQLMIDEVVRQIAAKLGNTKETIEVQVAAGEDHLNRAGDFMDKQLWSRALDELNVATVFAKPGDEAYRQYDLGLVHEAMGYEAKLLADQKSNLLQAQEFYDKALEMNRKEKYFVECVARLKTALARYKSFEGMQRTEQARSEPPPAPAPVPVAPPPVQQNPVQQNAVKQNPPRQQPAPQPTPTRPVAARPAAPAPAQRAPAPAPKPSAAALPPVAAKPTAKTLRVGDVIEMFASGVPEDQIAAIIRASAVQFDPLDKDTAIQVARAKLPVSLQNEMRARVGAPLLGPAKPASQSKNGK